MLTPCPLPSVRSRRTDATVATSSAALGLPGQASDAFPAEGTFLGSTQGSPRSAAVTITCFSAAASSALLGALGDGVGVLSAGVAATVVVGSVPAPDPPQPVIAATIISAEPGRRLLFSPRPPRTAATWKDRQSKILTSAASSRVSF